MLKGINISLVDDINIFQIIHLLFHRTFSKDRRVKVYLPYSLLRYIKGRIKAIKRRTACILTGANLAVLMIKHNI